jgi:hypothetical protein
MEKGKNPDVTEGKTVLFPSSAPQELQSFLHGGGF